MTDPHTLIHWLLDNKLAETFMHKGSQEQMLGITEFGIEVNTVLDKLKTTSEKAKQTNEILENSNIGILSSFSKKDISELENLDKKDEVMTPEERCYKILQESKFIRIPEEDPAELLPFFLDAIKGCTWEYPKDAIQEKQFETNVKTCFSQFHDELFQFAKDNPATINGETQPFKDVGLHTMDDQGFEGQIMSDGTFFRTIESETEYIFFKVSDEELESQWQAQATIIQQSALASWHTEDKEEEARLRKIAEEAQEKQSSVQAEITRRHK